MQKLTVSFRNSFMRMCFALILPVMIFTSCEEQVDDLWNTDDDGQKVSPLVGDWYADSMQIFGECVVDSAYDLMLAKNISDYNLWLLSDGSFQMVVSQSLSIKDECEYVYGTWDNETGCSSSYYDYYNYSPFQYCNVYYEFDQYNFGTTNCSQDVTIEGTWTADETASTVTLTLNDFCENSFGDPSYISDSNGCGSLEDGSWNTGMTRTYSYTINSDSGTVSLDGKWFDGASTCAKFYLSM